MVFLEQEKPIATCASKTCEACAVREIVHCHFRPRALIHFWCVILPGFLVGGTGVYRVSGWLLGLWIALIIGCFGFLKIRVMCSKRRWISMPKGLISRHVTASEAPLFCCSMWCRHDNPVMQALRI
jgi:hypothetical protein